MSGARGVVRFRAGEMAEKMRLPLIIKSVDGVGCEGVNFPRMPPYSDSYTGRRRVVNINLAQAIRGGRPPERSVSITQPGQAGIED